MTTHDPYTCEECVRLGWTHDELPVRRDARLILAAFAGMALIAVLAWWFR